MTVGAEERIAVHSSFDSVEAEHVQWVEGAGPSAENVPVSRAAWPLDDNVVPPWIGWFAFVTESEG